MILIAKRTISILLTLALLSAYNTGCSQDIEHPKRVKNLLGEEISTDSIEAFLSEKMTNLKVPGLSMAIINDGKVVYHLVKGYADLKKHKKVTSKTIFEGASLSKPLFAYFVMGFVEEGKLDLDKPLYEYMPYQDIAYDERYKKITARMVLSHTTGFPNWRTDSEENKLFIEFEPSTKFSYSGEGYQYLAKVLMHILGTNDKGLEKIYQKRIAKPIGMVSTKFIQDKNNLKNKSLGYKNEDLVKGNDDPTVFGSAYSIHSEALDFSKWIIALMKKEGLSKKSYDMLFESQVELPTDHPQRQEGITDWTLGFAVATFPFGSVYGHGGNNYGYTSLFAMHPETNWGFIIFTNADQSTISLQLMQYLLTPSM